jgi:hypothetical protein
MLRTVALVAFLAIIASPSRADDAVTMALELQSLQLESDEINALLEVHYRLLAAIDESEPAIRRLRETVRKLREQVEIGERELTGVCSSGVTQAELIVCLKTHMRHEASRSAYRVEAAKLEKLSSDIDARRKRQEASADPLFNRRWDIGDRMRQLRTALAGIVRRACTDQCWRAAARNPMGNLHGCLDACWRGEPVDTALEQHGTDPLGGERSQAERNRR